MLYHVISCYIHNSDGIHGDYTFFTYLNNRFPSYPQYPYVQVLDAAGDLPGNDGCNVHRMGLRVRQQITGWEPTGGVAVGFMMGVSPVSPMKFWWLSHVESHSVNRCWKQQKRQNSKHCICKNYSFDHSCSQLPLNFLHRSPACTVRVQINVVARLWLRMAWWKSSMLEVDLSCELVPVCIVWYVWSVWYWMCVPAE